MEDTVVQITVLQVFTYVPADTHDVNHDLDETDDYE